MTWLDTCCAQSTMLLVQLYSWWPFSASDGKSHLYFVTPSASY